MTLCKLTELCWMEGPTLCIFRKDMKIPLYVSSLVRKWNLNLFIAFTVWLSLNPWSLRFPYPLSQSVCTRWPRVWYHGSFSWLQSETLGAQIQVTKFLLGKTLKDFCSNLSGSSFLAFPLPTIPIFSRFPVYGNLASSPRPDDPSAAKNWGWEARHASLVKVRRLSRPACACPFHPSVTFPKARL